MRSIAAVREVASRPGKTMPAMPHISGDVFQALRDEIRRLGGGLSPRAMLPHVTEAGLGQPGALARIPQELFPGVDHRIGGFRRDEIRLAGRSADTEGGGQSR